MLTAEGCKARRARFWDRMPPNVQMVVFADVTHLRYFANCYVTPISLGGDFLATLVLHRGGLTTLVHDGRLPATVKAAHVDEAVAVKWYDGQSPGHGPRQLAYLDRLPAPPADILGGPFQREIVTAVAEMRRQKDPDEIATLEACCRAGEAGQAWALENLRAGMTELDAYSGVCAACAAVAGEPVIVYGDFAVSPGAGKHGGPPTRNVVKDGDTFILDFSVVIGGYRSDFTNTICIGGSPTAAQQKLMDQCRAAMTAGESKLKAGAACQAVYDAVRGVFADAGVSEAFPHHAGHGLGLMHPEAPYLVRHSEEALQVGDVVTLEPGLYVTGTGGVRIEHNYLITEAGFRTLSRHRIGLTTVDAR